MDWGTASVSYISWKTKFKGVRSRLTANEKNVGFLKWLTLLTMHVCLVKMVFRWCQHACCFYDQWLGTVHPFIFSLKFQWYCPGWYSWWKSRRRPVIQAAIHAAAQRQTAVTAHFSSKQLPLFVLASRHGPETIGEYREVWTDPAAISSVMITVMYVPRGVVTACLPPPPPGLSTAARLDHHSGSIDNQALPYCPHQVPMQRQGTVAPYLKSGQLLHFGFANAAVQSARRPMKIQCPADFPHEWTLTQWCLNVGPWSVTLAQQHNNVGSSSRFNWDQSGFQLT